MRRGARLAGLAVALFAVAFLARAVRTSSLGYAIVAAGLLVLAVAAVSGGKGRG
jgi:hypothetical protein